MSIFLPANSSRRKIKIETTPITSPLSASPLMVVTPNNRGMPIAKAVRSLEIDTATPLTPLSSFSSFGSSFAPMSVVSASSHLVGSPISSSPLHIGTTTSINSMFNSPMHSPISVSRSVMVPSDIPVFTMTSMTKGPDNDDHWLNDDPYAQRQVIKDLHYRFLDDWLPRDFPNILQYLKVKGKTVTLVKSKAESEKNNIDNDSSDDHEERIDYIEEHYLTLSNTKSILRKIMKENRLKWYNLPHNKTLVKHVMAHFIKKEIEKSFK